MLARTSRVAVGAGPVATVVVVGGDPIVAQALVLLLRGSGYEARFEPLRDLNLRRATGGVPALVLLAPGLDEWDRGTVFSSAGASYRDGDPPVLELVSANASRHGAGHTVIPWPCRTEDLEREIEAALSDKQNGADRAPVLEGRVTHDQGHRPRR